MEAGSQVGSPLLRYVKLTTDTNYDRVSCGPGCPGSHYVAEAGLELLAPTLSLQGIPTGRSVQGKQSGN